MTSDPDLTCAENIGIHARLFGITGAQRRQRTEELLAAVGLSDRANAMAATLSGGMRVGSKSRAAWCTIRKFYFSTSRPPGLDPVSRISVWGDDHAPPRAARPHAVSDHALHGRGPTVFAIAWQSSTRERWWRWIRRCPLKASVPGASRIEIQFDPDLPNGAADLEKLPSVKSVRSPGVGHLSHFERSRPGIGAGVDPVGARFEARTESAVGAVYDSRRCVPTFHGPRSDGDAGNGARRAAAAGEAIHETRLGIGRARYAQIPP